MEKKSSSKKCHCGDTVLDFMLIFWVKFLVVTPLQGGSTYTTRRPPTQLKNKQKNKKNIDRETIFLLLFIINTLQFVCSNLQCYGMNTKGDNSTEDTAVYKWRGCRVACVEDLSVYIYFSFNTMQSQQPPSHFPFITTHPNH